MTVLAGDVLAIQVATCTFEGGATIPGEFQLDVGLIPDQTCLSCVGLCDDANGVAAIDLADAIAVLSFPFNWDRAIAPAFASHVFDCSNLTLLSLR